MVKETKFYGKLESLLKLVTKIWYYYSILTAYVGMLKLIDPCVPILHVTLTTHVYSPQGGESLTYGACTY